MKKKLSFFLAFCLSISLFVLPTSALELEDARELLRDHYVDPIPEEILSLGTLEEILTALNDPYTVYYTAEEYASFLNSVNGETVVGIGVSLQTVFDEGFQILAILPDSPALEAGLEAGDRIIAVDGVTLTATSDITGMVTGAEGTPVTITVLRQADGTQRDFTLVRRVVTIPIVTYEAAGDACIIDCSSFGDSTADVICKALTELEDQVSTWILDLRSNPGGSATAAAASAGYFAGSNTMMYLRDANDRYSRYYTNNWPDLTDKPLIVLTSAYSASGAESFAGDARDHGFGIGVGQRTFGKGIAQTVFSKNNTKGLFEGDAFKITTDRFFSPNGTTNHVIGVLPTLLVSGEHAATIAQLLSAAEARRTTTQLKLELAGHTFYINLKDALDEANTAAFTELLEALPPSATLYRSVYGHRWDEVTPEQFSKYYKLDFRGRTFADAESSPYSDAIQTLAVYRLISGYEDGTFRPGQNISRAEFCAMIAAALDLPAADAPLNFTDVPEGTWYYAPISSMVARGFIAGCGDGTFRPNATITYQEAVTILSAVGAWVHMHTYELAKEDVNVQDFCLYYDWAEWARRPVRNLVELGMELDILSPAKLCTRETAADLLYDFLTCTHILWD